MTLLAFAIFAGALGGSIYAIAITILPNSDRIMDALAGRPQSQFAPLAQLAHAERRIAVRRWASPPRSAPFRAAA